MNISRESVFTTAIRALLGTFFGLLGALIALGVFSLGVSLLFPTRLAVDNNIVINAPDAEWNRAQLPETAPVILRLDITEVIGMGRLKGKAVKNTMLTAIERFGKTKRLKGIFLNINTPGGVAVDGNQIYSHIVYMKERFKVPVYAYAEGLCASAGMMIACSADKIYAGKESIIGSVGVILGPTLGFSGLMEKYGVEAVTITQGKDKDMLNPTKPFDPKSYESITKAIESSYHSFVELVSTARPKLTAKKLINEYGAQIYAPQEALEKGYVDYANSSYDEAMAALAKEAGIEGQYQVVQIQSQQAVFKEFLEENSLFLKGRVEHRFDIPGALPVELQGKILHLYKP